MAIKIPGYDKAIEFQAELEERLKELRGLRDLFSAQAKVSETESTAIN